MCNSVQRVMNEGESPVTRCVAHGAGPRVAHRRHFWAAVWEESADMESTVTQLTHGMPRKEEVLFRMI